MSQPNKAPIKKALAIDLGTTNSLISYSENTHPIIIPIDDNNSIASVVNIFPDNSIAIGNNWLDPEIYRIKSIKRLMGKNYSDIQNNSELLKKYNILYSDDIQFNIHNKLYSPIDISAEILKKLKLSAEKILCHEVSDVIITVPAYFDDAARQATKEAAELAGLKVIRLLNEPTAAALAYGLDKSKEGIYIVYDLGGGTFDVSILKIQYNVFQVLSTGGDLLLGGDDFDIAIRDYFITILNLDFSLINDFDKQRLLDISRQAKEYLSNFEEFNTEIYLNNSQIVFSLNKTQFENIIKDYVNKTLNITKDAISRSKIQIFEIKGIILVGGTTRIPYIQQELQKNFKLPIFSDLNPDEVVALGAALQAEALTQGSEHLLLDVTPLSLGLELMGGLVEKIIPRNSPIPISISQEFTTFQDGQTGMQFHILQGERESVQDCRSLAYFEINDLPPRPAGSVRVKISFEVDANSILTVSAYEQYTQTTKKIEIKTLHGLEYQEIKKILLDSNEHQAQDLEIRLLLQTKLDAEQLIYEVDKLLNNIKISEIVYSETKKQLQILRNSIKTNNRKEIEQNTKDLNKLIQPLITSKIQTYFGSILEGQNLSDIQKTLNYKIKN